MGCQTVFSKFCCEGEYTGFEYVPSLIRVIYERVLLNATCHPDGQPERCIKNEYQVCGLEEEKITRNSGMRAAYYTVFVVGEEVKKVEGRLRREGLMELR